MLLWWGASDKLLAVGGSKDVSINRVQTVSAKGCMDADDEKNDEKLQTSEKLLRETTCRVN